MDQSSMSSEHASSIARSFLTSRSSFKGKEIPLLSGMSEEDVPSGHKSHTHSDLYPLIEENQMLDQKHDYQISAVEQKNSQHIVEEKIAYSSLSSEKKQNCHHPLLTSFQVPLPDMKNENWKKNTQEENQVKLPNIMKYMVRKLIPFIKSYQQQIIILFEQQNQLTQEEAQKQFDNLLKNIETKKNNKSYHTIKCLKGYFNGKYEVIMKSIGEKWFLKWIKEQIFESKAVHDKETYISICDKIFKQVLNDC